jgi:MFS family permease
LTEAAAPSSPRPIRAAPEWPLLLAIFLDLAGFGALIPDIQTRLEGFGAHGWLIGTALAIYFVVQTIVSPLWGRTSDRMGRKGALLACFALSALSFLIYGLAQGIVGVFASRILAGLAAANVALAQAQLIADRADDTARTAALGRAGAAVTSGLIVGPAAGGFLAHVGGNFLLGVCAAAASGLGLLCLALFVPASPPQPAPETPEASPKARLALLQEIPALRPLFVLAATAWLALACLEGTFGRLIHVKLGYGPAQFGLLFGYEAVIGVVVQTLLLTPVTARLAPRRLLRLAYGAQGLGLGLTPFAPNLAGLFVASTFFALGTGFANPTVNARCSAVTPPGRQGEMFGLLQATRSLGFLLGPIGGGALFDWRPEAPYLLAAVVLGVAAVLVPRSRAVERAAA